MNMISLEQQYKELQEDYGAFPNGELISESELSDLRGRVPMLWVEFLIKYGKFTYRNGLVHTCGPNDLKQILALVFGADPDFSHQNTTAIGYSAFGEVFFWHHELGEGVIDVYNGSVTCSRLTDTNYPPKNDRVIIFFLSRRFERYDTGGKPLFKRALKTLGELKWGEVYGFVPALALGGEEKLENLKIQPMLPHFAMVAQLQPFYLVDVQGPMPEQQIKVREIG